MITRNNSRMISEGTDYSERTGGFVGNVMLCVSQHAAGGRRVRKHG